MTPLEHTARPDRPSPRYLADTSVLWRLLRGTIGEPWPERVAGGLVTICPVAHAELRHGLRPGQDGEPLYLALDRAFGSVPMREFDKQTEAMAVQRELKQRGVGSGGRDGPNLMDVVTALTARFHGLTLVHADADFDHIAAVCPDIPMIKLDPGPPVPPDEGGTRRRPSWRRLLDDL
ncbi:PIN domain-containing protein [Streptomyces sp. NPDC051018]|uniref:PIN domain-containing protein n=1 Tax=Streptomyces sp. NPDC051018 TaxID=3365639 RepID=UPI0037ACFF6F